MANVGRPRIYPDDRAKWRETQRRQRRNRGGTRFLITAEAVCALCGAHERLGIDHDHTTGENRGILCWRCNVGLGFLQDHPDLLRHAAHSLDTHEAVCAICGTQAPLCRDRDPLTRRVRGMLCRHCHAGIGFLQDNPAIMLEAAHYLDTHNATHDRDVSPHRGDAA